MVGAHNRPATVLLPLLAACARKEVSNCNLQFFCCRLQLLLTSFLAHDTEEKLRRYALDEEVAVAICNYLLPLVAMFRVAVVAHILSS